MKAERSQAGGWSIIQIREDRAWTKAGAVEMEKHG